MGAAAGAFFFSGDADFLGSGAFLAGCCTFITEVDDRIARFSTTGFLATEALLLGAALEDTTGAALGCTLAVTAFATDLERRAAFLGATETDLLALAILVSALRAAFWSRLRRGAADLTGLLLLERAGTATFLIYFLGDSLRLGATETLLLGADFFGDVAAFLDFESGLTEVLDALTTLEGDSDFLGAATGVLALDWLRLARGAGFAGDAFFSTALIDTDFLGDLVGDLAADAFFDFSTVLDLAVLVDLIGDAFLEITVADFLTEALVGETALTGEADFLTGETPFMGDSLRLLEGDLWALALLTDLGFTVSDVSGSEGMPKPRPMNLTGEAGFDSILGTRALNIVLAATTEASVAAAPLPLSDLRVRPRRSSSLGAGFSFLALDLDLAGCFFFSGEGLGLTGDFLGEADAFFGETVDFFGEADAFLTTLLERDFLSDF